ncbi:MAG: hotdog fold thioesterase [Gammaproteobacteria bacterium]|nr:hotdog fold thioesterase [Gammaproteobacteria bacterium]NNJ85161.1 hotdog fold thioesterase [Gammaproteobacteria bacterium]
MPELTVSNMTIEAMNGFLEGSLVGHLGIEILEVGDGFVKGRMPLDERTRQPQGALHGGASLAFAETLGGVGSAYYLDLEKQFPIGVEINANHIRAVTAGHVYGTATALHLGKRTHVWEIKIVDEQGRLTCASRFTQTIIDVGVTQDG